MANICDPSENFSGTGWIQTTITITAGAAAAPAFAGPSATMATAANDTGGDLANLYSPTFVGLSSDDADWIVSLFVQKNATAAPFPILGVNFGGGSSAFAAISLNLDTGATVNDTDFGAPADKGSVDVDATWWRFWLRLPNVSGNGNTAVRMFYYPAYAATAGATADAAQTRNTIIWGASIKQESSISTYDPVPFYSFGGSLPFMTAALPIFR